MGADLDEIGVVERRGTACEGDIVEVLAGRPLLPQPSAQRAPMLGQPCAIALALQAGHDDPK